MQASSSERNKRRAAERAAEWVESGMAVGLGAGTTAAFALVRISERVRARELEGCVFVACAESVAVRARALGLSVGALADAPALDLTIDGADEVSPELDLVKGRGGALLREKMLAQASRREVIVIDPSKLSPRLGTRSALPVEVLHFGWRAELRFLERLGAEPALRTDARGEPFLTDNGNLILDCRFGPIADAHSLAATLDARAGIAAHGLFLGLASDVLVGEETEVRHLEAHRGSS